jgi:sulfite reductase alpha subunit-like flavoprotein
MATLYVLYGSATGNAEHIAKDLASRPCPAPFGSMEALELDSFKKKKLLDTWKETPSHGLQKHGVLLVASTTGNGDPPENASRFVRYIKRKATVTEMPFSNCAFAVLGLGDTNYDQFCATGQVRVCTVTQLILCCHNVMSKRQPNPFPPLHKCRTSASANSLTFTFLVFHHAILN